MANISAATAMAYSASGFYITKHDLRQEEDARNVMTEHAFAGAAGMATDDAERLAG